MRRYMQEICWGALAGAAQEYMIVSQCHVQG